MSLSSTKTGPNSESRTHYCSGLSSLTVPVAGENRQRSWCDGTPHPHHRLPPRPLSHLLIFLATGTTGGRHPGRLRRETGMFSFLYLCVHVEYVCVITNSATPPFARTLLSVNCLLSVSFLKSSRPTGCFVGGPFYLLDYLLKRM